jgi:hypothetical protein
MRFGTVLFLRRNFRPQLVVFCRRFIAKWSGNAQSGQLLEIEKQPPTQFSASHGGMHDPVATKGRAKLGSGQGIGARQIPRQLCQLSPPAGRTVSGAQQQGGPSASYRVANPVEPGNRQAGPSGQPERVDNAAGQQQFKPVREIRRHRYGPSRRAGKDTLRHGAVHYIAAWRQPQTASGEPLVDIGDDRPVGSDDKAQQPGAIAHFPGGDAAALRRGGSLRRPID